MSGSSVGQRLSIYKASEIVVGLLAPIQKTGPQT